MKNLESIILNTQKRMFLNCLNLKTKTAKLLDVQSLVTNCVPPELVLRSV